MSQWCMCAVWVEEYLWSESISLKLIYFINPRFLALKPCAFFELSLDSFKLACESMIFNKISCVYISCILLSLSEPHYSSMQQWYSLVFACRCCVFIVHVLLEVTTHVFLSCVCFTIGGLWRMLQGSTRCARHGGL